MFDYIVFVSQLKKLSAPAFAFIYLFFRSSNDFIDGPTDDVWISTIDDAKVRDDEVEISISKRKKHYHHYHLACVLIIRIKFLNI